jgi:hypothetical protein
MTPGPKDSSRLHDQIGRQQFCNTHCLGTFCRPLRTRQARPTASRSSASTTTWPSGPRCAKTLTSVYHGILFSEAARNSDESFAGDARRGGYCPNRRARLGEHARGGARRANYSVAGMAKCAAIAGSQFFYPVCGQIDPSEPVKTDNDNVGSNRRSGTLFQKNDSINGAAPLALQAPCLLLARELLCRLSFGNLAPQSIGFSGALGVADGASTRPRTFAAMARTLRPTALAAFTASGSSHDHLP